MGTKAFTTAAQIRAGDTESEVESQLLSLYRDLPEDAQRQLIDQAAGILAVIDQRRTSVAIEAAGEVVALAELILRHQASVDEPAVRGMASRIRDMGNTLHAIIADEAAPIGELYEQVMGYPMAELEAQADGGNHG